MSISPISSHNKIQEEQDLQYPQPKKPLKKRSIRSLLPNEPSPSFFSSYHPESPSPSQIYSPPLKKEKPQNSPYQKEISSDKKIESPPIITNLNSSLQINCYLLDGRILPIIKQKQKKSCGASCALMLALDHCLQHPESKLPSENFLKWVEYGNLTKAYELAKKLNEENFPSFVLYFFHESTKPKIPKEKTQESYKIEAIPFIDGSSILDRIGKIIQEKNISVAIAIDHPALGGHRIIIDKIEDNKVYLREPYSGKAYIESIHEIARQIFDCEIILGLYIDNKEPKNT